jgi:hypothetical protein
MKMASFPAGLETDNDSNSVNCSGIAILRGITSVLGSPTNPTKTIFLNKRAKTFFCVMFDSAFNLLR